jgi:hypothetical protein
MGSGNNPLKIESAQVTSCLGSNLSEKGFLNMYVSNVAWTCESVEPREASGGKGREHQEHRTEKGAAPTTDTRVGF